MSEQETEALILGAARAEFIAHGLKGARMQAIADRAGLNKALLHYYFRSKEKLYEVTLAAVVGEIAQAIQQAMDGANPGEDLGAMVERLVRAYTEVLKSNPDYPRLVLRELADGGDSMGPVARSLVPTLRRIRGELEKRPEVVPLGGFVHAMISLMSLVGGTFLFQPWYRQVLPAAGATLCIDDAFYEARVQSILALLRTGVGKNA